MSSLGATLPKERTVVFGQLWPAVGGFGRLVMDEGAEARRVFKWERRKGRGRRGARAAIRYER